MASTPKNHKVSDFLVDLSRLTQGQAAKLAGKPSSWLREREHLFDRNADGTYDARSFVRTLRTDFTAAELDDSTLEQVQQLAETMVDHAGVSLAVVVSILLAVQEGYGAPGLAVLGEAILGHATDMRRTFGDKPGYEPVAADDIRREAEQRIQHLEDRKRREKLRSVLVCGRCNRHRWGRNWRDGAAPNGYAETGTICPGCEEKQA